MELHDLRREYVNELLDVSTAAACPVEQFAAWFEQAQKAELPEPNAMVLSTVDEKRRPSQRTVLLKYFDLEGFVFFTNYRSRKAKQIAASENVSLLFPWFPLARQVEIDGVAQKITKSESLRYFLKRPRESQLGAWVSTQSEVISNRKVLESKMADLRRRFGEGEIPLPDFWGGYRVRPRRFEFWQGGSARLHDRLEYSRTEAGPASWRQSRLSP